MPHSMPRHVLLVLMGRIRMDLRPPALTARLTVKHAPLPHSVALAAQDTISKTTVPAMFVLKTTY